MPSIKTIETFLVQLPPRREHKWTGLTEVIGRYVIVKVTDSDGRVGWGEAPALKDWGGEFGRYFGESAAIVKLVIENYLAPVVIGIELGNFVDLHARMDAIIKGYPYSKAALEFAIYDVTARWLGVPVHVLLGGKRSETIPVAHSIGLISIEEAQSEVRTIVREGVKTIKVKIGQDPERDIAMVGAVRAAAGDSIDICVDANEGYATPALAVQTYRRIEPFRIKYFEQPVMGIERIADVGRRIDAPVMADESAWNAHDAIQIIATGGVGIISIYTTKSGGLYKAMELGAVCRAAGIVCNVNGSIETGIGNLANVQLAAACPAVSLPCVIPVSTPQEAQKGQIGGIYYKDDLLVEPMQFVDGAIVVPSGVGMGIDVDLKKVEKYQVKA